MATFSSTNGVTNTTAATFIPEIWSDEIVAAYKRNLVMANLVKKMSFKGKKGDTIHVPTPTRGTASAKTSLAQVTLQASTESDTPIYINKHYEYSRLIEDITEAQALSSLRRFYTEDAGYALAKQVDTDLIQLGRGANGGNSANTQYAGGIIGSTGADYTYGTSNAANIADAGIRTAIQQLDDADVPMEGRVLVVPPVARNNMLGIARFTEQAFKGNGDTLMTGQFGDIYGVSVYVSTNCDTAAGNTNTDRVALMFHKDWAVLVEQMGVRSQTQYMQEFLATLYTADMLYGTAELRDTSCVPIIVDASAT
jgi:N4-gp56 family major capsid protein